LISSIKVESGILSHRPSVAITIKSFSSTLNDVTDARSGLSAINPGSLIAGWIAN